MKKSTAYFQAMIKENKDKLLSAGIPWATVRSWIYGQRVPSIENAIRIAEILNKPLSEIAYRQIILNRP